LERKTERRIASSRAADNKQAAGSRRSPDKKNNKVKLKRPERKLGTGGCAAMLAATYALLALELVFFMAGSGINWQSIVGACLVLFIGFAVFGLYAKLKLPEISGKFGRMLSACVLILIAAAPLPFTMSVNLGFMTHILAALLLALIAGDLMALAAMLPAAIVGAIIARTLESPQVAPAGIFLLVAASSTAAVLALRIGETRTSTVLAAGAAGLVGAVAYAAFMLASGEPIADYWQTLIWTVGSSIVCGVLAVGLMPVFESVFDIASDARLNELLNNNHPLLKRLMTEASGTYQHSLTVATLAEAAAESIGANALLCRVAATYHDVGKLKDPLCFKENQRGGRNMHDELDPYESARRIIAHQQDGVKLLEKYKLPGEVIRIAGEHHGDSVMVYFYDKAKKQVFDGSEVDESLFRYPSHKPTTRESAILMLADCCEAAVRSMKEPTMQDVAAKVREVITHKWDKRDSMLWDSPLTFVDVRRIEASFLRTFSALYHERVEYPDMEAIDVR
jgi:putative nucleotidyltransferase with HDIG domain